MPSERVQRQIDRLLDEIEAAIGSSNWPVAQERARSALALDPENEDARSYLEAAERALGREASPSTAPVSDAPRPSLAAEPAHPSSFANGRYQVRELLGEGGKKRVYRAHDTLLDRDVAFALIKTEGLDDAGRQRVRHEARAMGRLGSHPNIVAVLDLGEERGQPYLVTELMPGGALTAAIQQAPDHRLPIERAVDIARQICAALEHAHARQLIHRDLKPGNLWLTEAGTAKLGDFGLAVALDQTRHTQPGMMIGTVSYMAPEQAIGGVVDARSDLYSLGCLLYELICGRPPFIGDDAVAIIGQHLNSPPVAPTWHRSDCPPGLEALILRLLEKDAARRPGSAAEVISALAGLDPPQSPRVRGEAPPVGFSRSGASPEPGRGRGTEGGTEHPLSDTASPLYRQTFVGREAELRQLEHAYDTAISGQGGLVMVVGEPGIGKTSLCEQLATYAAVRGGRTLVGHCYEEGSLSLPYLPFVEAMRSYVLGQEPDALTTALGSAAGDVARVVSEVRERLKVEPRPPSGDANEDRWRLLEAVTEFLRNASAVQPILLVLEDLHWADRGTLDLLLHVSRRLTGARLLVVGTYRDVEVDRTHPLSGALADLRRTNVFTRIGVRGLTVDEVHRMMNRIRGQDVPWSRAEAIHRQTEGNPLFVQEVLRYLVEEGLVVREGTRYVLTEAGAELSVPEGLRDVVGKRLSRLSDQANHALSVASVIGREFRLDVLEHVAGMSEDALYAALDESRDRAVVEERSTLGGGVTYRFTHAFFRQTLYEELSAPRRIRMHQQVARALEQIHTRRLDEHAAELAEHFAHSSVREDLQKAIDYGERAAQRALSVFAYGEAARHLEQALEVQTMLDPDNEQRRVDLLLGLGDALLPVGESERVEIQLAPEAYELAQRRGDRKQAVRAARLALDSLHRRFLVMAHRQPAWHEWAERADANAADGTADRAYADLALARLRITAGDRDAGLVLLSRSLGIARTLDDPELLCTVAWQTIHHQMTLTHWREAISLAREFADRPRDRLSSRTAGQLLEFCGAGLLVNNDRAGAERAWGELTRLAERSSDVTPRTLALGFQGFLATLDGRLDEAVSLGRQALELSTDAGATGARVATLARCGRALVYRGATDEIQEWQGKVAPAPSSPINIVQGLGLAYTGHLDEAREKLRDQMQLEGFGTDASHAEHIAQAGCAEAIWLYELATAAGDMPIVKAIAPHLIDVPPIPTGIAAVGCSLRVRGAALVLLGETDDARRLFEQAIEYCARLPFRPELALSHLALAELLLDEAVRTVDAPDPTLKADGIRHLDLAIGMLQDMKMHPFLERALRRKLQIQGVDAVSPSTSIAAVAVAVAAEQPSLQAHAAPDGTVTILFTDIEDSTSLIVKLGDQRWLEVLRAHHALVREHVRRFGGFEVKNQGDGFMLAFGSARRALECAVSIQRAINTQPMDPPIPVRMGLHTGEVLKEADDFHGKHVVLAARIADQAHGGEILVSALLKELTDSGGDLSFDAGVEVELKGIQGRHRLYPLKWDT